MLMLTSSIFYVSHSITLTQNEQHKRIKSRKKKKNWACMFPLLPTCEAKLLSILWDCERFVYIHMTKTRCSRDKDSQHFFQSVRFKGKVTEDMYSRCSNWCRFQLVLLECFTFSGKRKKGGGNDNKNDNII
jgi:hypothetical protein